MKKIALGFFAIVGVILVAIILWGGLDTVETACDLRVCWGPEPKSLDPAIITGLLESRYVYSLFEGLMTYDRDNTTPIPGMASKVRRSDDERVYTFTIRPDAKWSNGRPVTADDFVYSWRRILDAKVEDCEYAYMLYYIRNAEPYHGQSQVDKILEKFSEKSKDDKIKSIKSTLVGASRRRHVPRLRQLVQTEGDLSKQLEEVVAEADKRPELRFEDVGIHVRGDELEVTLENPTPFIDDIFGFMTLMPVPKETVEAYGDQWIKPEHIVCNGPFVVERWQPHYAIVLKKNPHYYDRGVSLNRVLCRVVDTGATALNYYERGMVDWIDKAIIPADFVEALRDRPDFKKFEVFGSTFLRFNVTRPPFNDVRVRRAFAMALDKGQVVETLNTGETVTDRLVPPFPGYLDVQPAGLSPNAEQARKLLAEVYPDLSKFPKVEYLMRNTSKNMDIFKVIREQVKTRLGVTIEPKAQEWQIYLASIQSLDYELSLGGWYGDYSDPNTFIDMWVTDGGNNRTGWSSPEYDALVKANLAETDQHKRFQIMAKCEKMVLEDACILAPLYMNIDYVLHRPYVKGLETRINPMDRFMLRFVSVER